MATPSSRPVDDLRKAVERRFGGLDKDVQQIKRELFNIPKPAAPAPAGSGIIGTTWATVTSHAIEVHSGESYSSLQTPGWSFAQPNTPGTGPTFTVSPTDDNALIPATPGWFSARLHFEIAFASNPPAVVALSLFCGPTTAYGEVTTRAGGGWARRDLARVGAVGSLYAGPEFVGEYDDNVGLAITWPGVAATIYQVVVRVEIAEHSGPSL